MWIPCGRAWCHRDAAQQQRLYLKLSQVPLLPRVLQEMVGVEELQAALPQWPWPVTAANHPLSVHAALC